MKHISILLFLLLFKIGFSQDFKNLTGKWSTSTFPKFVYEFDSLRNVRFDWINDLGSFHRKGEFSIQKDTVVVEFEPLFTYKSLSTSLSDSLSIFVYDKKNNTLPYYKICVVYKSGKRKVLLSNKNGVIFIPKRKKIDLLYLDHQYSSIPPKDGKLKAKKPKFYNPFYSISKKQIQNDSIKLTVDCWLMTYVFKSNTTRLLILSNDEIFERTNYNDETLYPRGYRLKKEKNNGG